MSFLRWKQKLLPLGNPQTSSPSSGGGGPTNTTVTNTNIPDYAQPYVSNMLNAAQAQIYTPDMTGFNPYTPYSTNPSDYVAGFSPLQQQAQSSTANLQTPGQYNTATNLAGTAGMGVLGTTGQAGMYGRMGNMAGQQGSQVSNMYGGQGVNAGMQSAGLSNMYGQQGLQAGQQAAGLSNIYGQQGSQIGQQASNVSNMYGGMGTNAGMNAAGQSSMYGGLAANQGQQGANIGQSLGQMSTNPNAVGAYMNPYLQQSLAPQLQLANQQYGIAGTQMAGQATGAGAFGGSRNALQQSLNQQNQMLANNQIINQGYNTAFNNAQAQMNAANQAALSGNAQALQGYNTGLQGAGQAGSQAMQGIGLGLQGSNQAATQALAGNQQALSGAQQAGSLGIQGAQAGLQGAGQAGSQAMQGIGLGLQGANQGANLGIAGAQAGLSGVGAQQAGYAQAGTQASNLANIGTQQLAAQQGIISTQAQQGATEQQNQQNIINQAVQNYATAQQYPYMQLGQLNAMLRGLPMQQSSTSMYQAAPSTASQLSGLGIAGLGASSLVNAAGHKRGGLMESKKMAVGGAVPMNMMSDQQLGQVQQNPTSSPMAKMNAQGLEQLHGYIHNNPQAGQMIQQGMPPAQQMAQAPQDRSGVASIATPPQMTQMAGGGIIAFADEGEVKDPAIPRTKSGELDWASILAPRLAEEQSGKGSVSEAYKPLAKTSQEDIAQQKAMLIPELATRFGLGLMNSQGGRGGSLLNKTLQDVGVSGLGAVQGMTSNLKDINAAKKTLQQGTIEATKADQQRRDQLTGVLANVYGTEQAKKIGLAQAAATRQAGLDAKQASLINAASTAYQTNVERVFKDLATQEKNALTFQLHPEQLWQQAREQVYNSMPEVTRNLINLQAPVAPAAPVANVPPAAPAAPAPVTVSVAGKTLQFPTQAAADAFKATPQYQALVNTQATD